jgi:hypothetical protein
MTSKEEMANWFRSRFETAGEALFHDSTEGGFQYPAGSGPIDVEATLQARFPDADLDVIKDLATDLEDEGPWVDMQAYDEKDV